MKDELIKLSTATLAHEKGFKETCYNAYSGMLRGCKSIPYQCGCCYEILPDTYTLQPTQSLLQRWLREVKDIHIEISAFEKGSYGQFSYKIIGYVTIISEYIGEYDSYEDALEEGLYKALLLV